jgi:hypothetical protein
VIELVFVLVPDGPVDRSTRHRYIHSIERHGGVHLAPIVLHVLRRVVVEAGSEARREMLDHIRVETVLWFRLIGDVGGALLLAPSQVSGSTSAWSGMALDSTTST